MADNWIPPTLADFRTLYPQFAIWDDATVQAWLDLAIAEIDAGDWVFKDRTPATLFLTAHWLFIMPPPQDTTGGGSGGEGTPPSGTSSSTVKSMTVGDVRLEYDSSSNAWTGGAKYGALDPKSVMSNLLMSPYGRQYYYLLRRNFPAVRVV